MNQPWVYMCSPSWTPLPPPSHSYHCRRILLAKGHRFEAQMHSKLQFAQLRGSCSSSQTFDVCDTSMFEEGDSRNGDFFFKRIFGKSVTPRMTKYLSRFNSRSPPKKSLHFWKERIYFRKSIWNGHLVVPACWFVLPVLLCLESSVKFTKQCTWEWVPDRNQENRVTGLVSATNDLCETPTSGSMVFCA